jgi:hypothetical protein
MIDFETIVLALLILMGVIAVAETIWVLAFEVWRCHLGIEFSAKIVTREKHEDDPYAKAVVVDGERRKPVHARYYFDIQLDDDAQEIYENRLKRWPWFWMVSPMISTYVCKSFDIQVDKATYSTEMELPQAVRVRLYPASMDTDSYGHWRGFESITIHDKEISKIDLSIARMRDCWTHKDKSM